MKEIKEKGKTKIKTKREQAAPGIILRAGFVYSGVVRKGEHQNCPCAKSILERTEDAQIGRERN